MLNWRTTVAGMILGLVPFIEGLANSIGSSSHIDWKSMGFGLGLMIFGILAKDAAVK